MPCRVEVVERFPVLVKGETRWRGKWRPHSVRTLSRAQAVDLAYELFAVAGGARIRALEPGTDEPTTAPDGFEVVALRGSVAVKRWPG
jgi:hypothetical protein